MDSQNLNIDQHPQLYFSDGDIALLAAKTPPENGGPSRYWVFRIHKVFLRHHSETFANMIADANAETDAVYDGVPLVEMYGDNAEDLAAMLSCMYNPSYVPVLSSPPSLPSASAEPSPSSGTTPTLPS